jgi:hypothetical protein
MKHAKLPALILIILLIVPLLNSCKKSPDFKNSEPVTYYLSLNESLSESAGPDGGWNYITNYIYPSGVTSCEWSVHLNHNITKGEFGYDLLFWSPTETIVKIEFILEEGSQETILASKNLTIPYISDSSAVQHHVEIDTNPLEGTNPKSGKDGELILRISYISGSDAVEVLYDANIGSIGCTSVTVYQDM